MTLSRKGKFKLEVVRKPKPRDLHSSLPERDKIGPTEESIYNCVKLWDPELKRQASYICVDNAEKFFVRLISMDQGEQETHGVVLYLDGRRITGRKTFKRVSVFPGLKKNKGKF